MEHTHCSDRVVDLLVDEQFKQVLFIFDLANAQLLFVARIVTMASNASSPSKDSIGMVALTDESTITDMSSICDDEALEVAMLEMTNVPTETDCDLPESWNPLLCDICQDEPKKNNQRYGLRCQLKVRKAQKRSKTQGKQAEAAFKQEMKRGGTKFRDVVLACNVQQEKFSRGEAHEPFDFLQYTSALRLSSKVSKTQEMEWMTQGEFVVFWKVKYETSDEVARQMWHRQLTELPASRMNSDKTEILYPRRRLVVAENARSREELITAGQKAKKTPSAEEWDRQLGNMGTGHEAFDDASWQSALGLGKDALDCLPRGQFASAATATNNLLPTQQDLQRQEEAKQQKKDEAEAKKLDRPFDSLGQTSNYKPQLLDKLKALERKIIDTIEKTNETVTDVQKDAGLRELMQEALNTLLLRRDMLVAIGQSQLHWQEFKASKAVVTAPDKEPIDDIGKYTCLADLSATCNSATLTGWQQSVDKKNEITNLFKQFNTLIAHVSSQAARITALLKARARREEKEKENADKRAVQLASRAMQAFSATQRQQAAQPKALVATRQCKIFESIEALDEEQKKKLHNVVTSAAINDGFPGVMLNGAQLKTPQFLNFTLVCGDDTDFKSFLNKFKSSRLYDPKTASGRGSEMILGDCCSRCPACPVKTPCDAISLNLTGADKQYIDTCWHWATHKDAKSGGPEFSSLHSVKFQKHGQRSVVAAPFGALANFAKGTVGSGGTLTLQKVIDVLAESDEQMLEAMLKAGVPLHTATIAEGKGLFMPWGWISCEQTRQRC